MADTAVRQAAPALLTLSEISALTAEADFTKGDNNFQSEKQHTDSKMVVDGYRSDDSNDSDTVEGPCLRPFTHSNALKAVLSRMKLHNVTDIKEPIDVLLNSVTPPFKVTDSVLVTDTTNPLPPSSTLNVEPAVNIEATVSISAPASTPSPVTTTATTSLKESLLNDLIPETTSSNGNLFVSIPTSAIALITSQIASIRKAISLLNQNVVNSVIDEQVRNILRLCNNFSESILTIDNLIVPQTTVESKGADLQTDPNDEEFKRGRLLKCVKHRRWKKKCPADCPNKPKAHIDPSKVIASINNASKVSTPKSSTRGTKSKRKVRGHSKFSKTDLNRNSENASSDSDSSDPNSSDESDDDSIDSEVQRLATNFKQVESSDGFTNAIYDAITVMSDMQRHRKRLRDIKSPLAPNTKQASAFTPFGNKPVAQITYPPSPAQADSTFANSVSTLGPNVTLSRGVPVRVQFQSHPQSPSSALVLSSMSSSSFMLPPASAIPLEINRYSTQSTSMNVSLLRDNNSDLLRKCQSNGNVHFVNQNSLSLTSTMPFLARAIPLALPVPLNSGTYVSSKMNQTSIPAKLPLSVSAISPQSAHVIC